MTGVPSGLEKGRVAHLITTLALGGAQKNTLHSVRRLRELGWDAIVICGPSELTGRASLEGMCRTLEIPLIVEPHLVRKVSPFHDALCLARLVALFKKEKFAFVHTHGSKAGIVGRLAAAITKVPYIVHTVHGWGFHDFQPRSTRTLFVTAERIVAPLTHQLISVSERGVREGIENGIGHPDQYTIIRSGIDLDQFAPKPLDSSRLRDELQLPTDKKIVGTVMRLCAQKDPFTFIRAAGIVSKKLESTHFLVVGDGKDRARVLSEAQIHGIDHKLTVTGYTGDVARHLACMDVFVLTSLWEGLPRAVVEAAATRVPIVATDAGGTRELIVNGKTGSLTPRRDEEAVAREIFGVFSEPAQTLARVNAAESRVRPEFCREQMVREIEQGYLKLLAHKKPKPPRDLILYLITDLNVGGAQIQLQRVLSRLDRTRFVPVVACLNSAHGIVGQHLRADGIPVIDLGLKNLRDLGAPLRLSSLILRLRPTVLHSWLYHADLLARTVGRPLGVPCIITSRRNLEIGGRRREIARALTRRMDDRVVAVCDAARAAEVSRTHTPPEKVVVIRNGISALQMEPSDETTRLRLRGRIGANPDSLVFGFVGRLHANKGGLELLSAFADVRSSHPDSRLVFVGDGAERGAWERRSRDLILDDNVVFIGEKESTTGWLRAFDVFVLPSYTEGISNAILEAMSASLPVIATRVGGTPELVVHKRTGLLVEPRNARALGRAMNRLADSESQRQVMGEAGRIRVQEEFSIAQTVSETEKLYDELIRNAASARKR